MVVFDVLVIWVVLVRIVSPGLRAPDLFRGVSVLVVSVIGCSESLHSRLWICWVDKMLLVAEAEMICRGTSGLVFCSDEISGENALMPGQG